MLDRTLSFGRFSLDPRGGLMSGTRSVRLTPKALALLSFMAGRPGEVIPKEELFAAVWPEVDRGRCRAGDLHPGASQSARRRCPAAALYRDAAPPRLPLHRKTGRGAGCHRREGPGAGAARPSLDRGAAVRQYERGGGPGILCRRHFGRPDHRPFPHPLAVRDRPQLLLCLQGPRGRRETGLARTRRALCAGRQRAPRGKTHPHQRAADRRDHRRPSLGGALRPRARRYLRRAGRDHPQRGGGDRAAPAGRGGHSRA